MTSIVVGSGALAETMAGLLCAAGRRVSIIAPSSKINEKTFDSSVIRKILQDDSEQKIPFEFVDDLRQQQKLAETNFRKIQVTTDLSRIVPVDQIVDASLADESALLLHTVNAVPKATVISMNEKSPIHENHVSLKIYNPITETKLVKLFVNKETTEKSIQDVRQLLDAMGFTVLSEEDSVVADRLVNDMQEVGKSTSLSKLMSVLMPPIEKQTTSINNTAHNEQLQILH